MKRLIETVLLKTHQEEVHKIEQFAERIADEYNIGDTYFANILVSLSEAFNNALVHGNKYDGNKSIKLDFFMSNKEMIFTMKDEGYGFDISIIKDETHMVGRGLMMIRHASDGVEFSDGGRCIEMRFDTASFNESLAMKRSAALEQTETKVKKNVQ
ncbi:MAG: ATP-binding protein [Bacteroidales bacterium]|nr:ATP-binding protein [Bacteroidales bacterium]